MIFLFCYNLNGIRFFCLITNKVICGKLKLLHCELTITFPVKIIDRYQGGCDNSRDYSLAPRRIRAKSTRTDIQIESKYLYEHKSVLIGSSSSYYRFVIYAPVTRMMIFQTNPIYYQKRLHWKRY